MSGVQTSLLEEPAAEPETAAPRKPVPGDRPPPPRLYVVFFVTTRYGRGSQLGYSRTFEAAIRTRRSAAGVIARALKEAVEREEGLEVERCS